MFLVVVLVLGHRRLELSGASYFLLAAFVILHIIGAHYTYARMPLGLWARDYFGLSRNHYDRFAHGAFGFLLVFPVRELLLRFSGISRRWSFWLSPAIILAVSGSFEIIESIVAEIVAPGKGVAWLGGQGDEWDAQNDMLSALVGSLLMTAVAAGYAELFRSRGEPIEGVVLRAFVPVSLHQEQPGEARGNIDAGMLVPLPIGERDDIRRLEKIAAETAERKKKTRPPAGSMFRTVLLQRAFLRLMPRQRFMNAYVTNVPGPPIPLYFAGAPLLEIFPIVPLTANISIGVGALSYARQFNLAVVADRDLCPDLEVFADGVRRSLEALERRVAPTAP